MPAAKPKTETLKLVGVEPEAASQRELFRPEDELDWDQFVVRMDAAGALVLCVSTDLLATAELLARKDSTSAETKIAFERLASYKMKALEMVDEVLLALAKIERKETDA
jgi:hypothetical protein